jgi:chloramphenicol-sensitive protein RarD
VRRLSFEREVLGSQRDDPQKESPRRVARAHHTLLMTLPSPSSRTDESLHGVFYGVAAYAWWGFAAIYFKIVKAVSPLEILAHRVLWSVCVLAVLITALRRWGAIRDVLRSRIALLWLSASAVLIAGNWFTYIWAVTRDHMLDASLGYFINPLVSVSLGYVFLGERLRIWERVSIGLAAMAVAWLTLTAGSFPWVALVLAVSFGLYGLVRKNARVGSIEALTIETAVLLPIAVAYLVWLAQRGALFFGDSPRMDLLLIAAGPLTALPLLWFASAVSRLRLATIGLLQYISPTIQFLLAVLVYREPFGGPRMIAFALIWIAVAIYGVDNLRRVRSTLPIVDV